MPAWMWRHGIDSCPGELYTPVQYTKRAFCLMCMWHSELVSEGLVASMWLSLIIVEQPLCAFDEIRALARECYKGQFTIHITCTTYFLSEPALERPLSPLTTDIPPVTEPLKGLCLF